MKKITKEEFVDRAMAIQRARKIFIETGLTTNITHAFEAYQEILAEHERQITVSSREYGTRTYTLMDDYERPACPDCGAEMRFRSVPQNEDGIKTQLVCTKCDTVLNDEHDLNWWIQTLNPKDENGEPKGKPSGLPERTQKIDKG